MNKYRNVKVSYDGITFDSKRECARYIELRMLEKAGQISGLQRQVKFEIFPKFGKERAIFYIADFVYEKCGKTVVEDVKSPATAKDKCFRLKWRAVRQMYAGKYDFEICL